MTYTYKLGNNGPIAEVNDDVEITKEEYKEAKKGFFGGPEEWRLHVKTPGSSTVLVVKKGTHSHSTGLKYKW